MSEITVSEEFVRQSERFLVEDLLPKIKAAVALLSEDELWWRPNPQSNSVGNMLLHLSGNVRQWIIAGVGQAPDRRQRDLEFVEQGPMPAQELMEHLENTVAEAVDVLRRMDRTALLDNRKIQAYEVTLVQAITHVVEHFSYHTGQIVYVAKLLKGVDTQFYNL
jgi:uncharacterized damage-inducible protein DinB